MAAQTCCDVTTTPARRRVVLAVTRRPSTSPSEARKSSKADELPGTGPSPAETRRRVVIRRKMEALRRLVPITGDGAAGGELDELLLEAAGYILRLQAQVKAMQAMADVLNPKD